MEHTTAKTPEWQHTGGTLYIPDGWFVHKVDLDAKEPYLKITKDDVGMSEEKKLLVPKSLAYYLSTHFCGSNVMRENIQKDTQCKIGNIIKCALGL